MTYIDPQLAASLYQFSGQDIPQQLRYWATHRGDKPFMIWQPVVGASRTWSYAELWHDAQAIAAGLYARGVGKGKHILIHSDNCPEMVLAWYACAILGAVAVTTNTGATASELAYFSAQADVIAAITQPHYAQLIHDSIKNLAWIAVTSQDSDKAQNIRNAWETIERCETFANFYSTVAAPERSAEPLLPSGIMFTSGTTSRPKAVVHTHANYLWAGRIGPRTIDMGPNDVHFAYMPFFHTNAQLWSFATALGVGACVVLLSRVTVSGFWDVVTRHRITHLSLMPLILRDIVTKPVPTHNLRVMQTGIVLHDVEKYFGVKTLGGWGMTETVVPTLSTDTLREWPSLTMGRPIPGIEVAVRDPDTGALCAADAMGELCIRGIRGVHIFLEYYKNPEANAKSFTEDGWFKTGDIVKCGADGNLYFCDRDKDMLKVGGENVSALQVEQIIAPIAGVREVAVVGKKHPALDEVPVAFVIVHEGVDTEELTVRIRESCQRELAKFKLPQEIIFLDDFPRALLGKVAKNQLRELVNTAPVRTEKPHSILQGDSR